MLDKLGVDLDEVRAQLATLREATGGETAVGTRWTQRVITAGPANVSGVVTAGPEDACSFCGRDLWDVERHVTSSSARICGECVEACRREIEEAEAQDRPGEQTLRLPPRLFGRRPTDDEAIGEVNRAFGMAFGGAGGDEERARYIEEGSVLAPLLSLAAARHPQSGGAVVHAVRFLSDDHAQVRFAIRIGGGEFPFTGDAVRLDGRWRVSRDTIGGMLARAGVTLP